MSFLKLAMEAKVNNIRILARFIFRQHRNYNQFARSQEEESMSIIQQTHRRVQNRGLCSCQNSDCLGQGMEIENINVEIAM